MNEREKGRFCKKLGWQLVLPQISDAFGLFGMNRNLH